MCFYCTNRIQCFEVPCIILYCGTQSCMYSFQMTYQAEKHQCKIKPKLLLCFITDNFLSLLNHSYLGTRIYAIVTHTSHGCIIPKPNPPTPMSLLPSINFISVCFTTRSELVSFPPYASLLPFLSSSQIIVGKVEVYNFQQCC